MPNGDFDKVEGVLERQQRRIVVLSDSAVILQTALAATIIGLIGVLFFTRRRQRSLGIMHDLAFTATITSFVLCQNARLSENIVLARLLPRDVTSFWNRYTFSNLNRALHMEYSHMRSGQSVSKASKTRTDTPNQTVGPASWSIWLLGAFLLCILVAISVLHWYSQTHVLSPTGSLYALNIKVDRYTLGRVAPYALLPTIAAVCAGMCLSESLCHSVDIDLLT